MGKGESFGFSEAGVSEEEKEKRKGKRYALIL